MPTTSLPDSNNAPWWDSAVVYQVYPRSFFDTTGSGIGNIAGVSAKLDYLDDLGVDALWLGPFYPSPQVDAGYDVADYCAVDPMFGDLRDFDELVEQAHKRDLRIVIDLVPNHSSYQHPLFQAALAAEPGSDARAIYHFHDGSKPPNNWTSVFGGPSWTQVAGQPGQWYYHLFAPEQPDFNWSNPRVLEYFEDVLRFWLERGVDGFRIDVSDALIKDTTWPDTADGMPVIPKDASSPVHTIYRRFREILDEYGAMAVIETGADDDTVALFLRPDEMHQAFNFRFLKAGWGARSIAKAIEDSMRAFDAVGASSTWVTDNHDTTRSVTRYGSDSSLSGAYIPSSTAAQTENVGCGDDRARAMAVLLLSLPGSAYVYSGQELGLPEVTDLPDESRQDPAFFRSNGSVLGRDGCRVPLPWSGSEPPFGFTRNGEPWLPQPADWRELTVERQMADPGSMLSLYRRLLRLRAREPALGTGNLEWVNSVSTTDATGLLHLRFAHESAPSIHLLLNFTSTSIILPSALERSEFLLSSASRNEERLSPNTAVLYREI